MPGPLQQLVQSLGLGAPEPWMPTPAPTSGTSGTPFVGPLEAPPAPAPLTGWRGAIDTGLNTLVGGVKGLTGLGDQGPAGPTAINAAALIGGIVPLAPAEKAGALLAGKFPRFLKALESYRAPTAAGKVAGPFYSRLDEAVAALPKQTFGPKIAGVVQKGQAAGEELAARGVPEFLAAAGNKPIQRAALEAHLEAHPVPQLAVKVLGETPERRAMQAQLNDLAALGSDRTVAQQREYDSLSRILQHQQDRGAAPKFAAHTLPGGDNYRETLITLPTDMNRAAAGQSARIKELIARRDGLIASKAALDPRTQLGDVPALETQLRNTNTQIDMAMRETPKDPGAYRSSHFDEPNILAHTRSNEREIPGLGKGTFLEEVQSDWHQAGKAKGYRTGSAEALEKRRVELELLGDKATDAQKREWADVMNQRQAHAKAVPDAPFKESWPDLALKHHLAEAAQDPTVNWIGFTSGETQAARYDLSKQVDTLKWYRDGDTYRITAKKDGATLVQKSGLSEHELSAAIGKDVAKSITGNAEQTGELSGLDLKVGGEGMRKFYDELLPKRLEKIVKPYGGVVERAAISGDPSVPAEVLARYADQPNHPMMKNQQVPVWILRLTPELKDRILKYGLPLMAGVAAVDASDDGAR